MDLMQREKICQLRDNGFGYTKIAQTLSLSVNTVKSYCRRNTNACTCLYCRKEIRIKSKVKPRKFCSDNCRYAWWSKHQGEIKHRSTNSFNCDNCGKQFVIHRNRQRKYCSHRCYILARYKKAGGVNER
jgi:endogenous inhibitor of DNA gyrase (YacG/DUF329 family)